MAGRQHGVVSRGQLLGLGMSADEIDFAIGVGHLHPVFRGAFAVGHPEVGRYGRMMAAVLACGRGSVVSHGTAAALLGLWETQPVLVDVIAPVEAGRKFAGIRRRHVPPPAGNDRRVHEGIPCTSPSRTIVDVAGMVGERSLARTVEQAAVLQVLDVPEIDEILATGPRRRGSPSLRLILDDWRRYPRAIRVRSPLEARLLPMLTRRGIPVPRCNSRLRLGGLWLEIDFLWPRHRLAVEADSEKYHGNPLAQARDSRRTRLLRAAGYEVRRISWDDLEHRPEATMNALARLTATV